MDLEQKQKNELVLKIAAQVRGELKRRLYKAIECEDWAIVKLIADFHLKSKKEKKG